MGTSWELAKKMRQERTKCPGASDELAKKMHQERTKCQGMTLVVP